MYQTFRITDNMANVEHYNFYILYVKKDSKNNKALSKCLRPYYPLDGDYYKQGIFFDLLESEYNAKEVQENIDNNDDDDFCIKLLTEKNVDRCIEILNNKKLQSVRLTMSFGKYTPLMCLESYIDSL